MKRTVCVVVIVVCVVGLLVAHGECEARKNEKPLHVWEAADSAWAVGGFTQLKPGFAEGVMAKKPPDVEGLKAFEVQVREPGEWLGFQVALRTVEKVTFTKNTKFVLIDKEGKRVESEAIVFWPDMLQTTLYDSRKMPVVVTKSGVWCSPSNGYPFGYVKFAAGSIELKNIVEFEVVGAIEEPATGEAKR